jgi:hypothetical protein
MGLDPGLGPFKVMASLHRASDLKAILRNKQFNVKRILS